MKTRILSLIAAIACCSARGEAPQPSSGITPAVFESRETADKYVKKLFAGGAVEALKVGKKEILIVYVYGSGVPNIAIAAYRFADGKWRRAAQAGISDRGIHRAQVRGGAVIIVSERSSEEIVLLKVDDEEN